MHRYRKKKSLDHAVSYESWNKLNARQPSWVYPTLINMRIAMHWFSTITTYRCQGCRVGQKLARLRLWLPIIFLRRLHSLVFSNYDSDSRLSLKKFARPTPPQIDSCLLILYSDSKLILDSDCRLLFEFDSTPDSDSLFFTTPTLTPDSLMCLFRLPTLTPLQKLKLPTPTLHPWSLLMFSNYKPYFSWTTTNWRSKNNIHKKSSSNKWKYW